MIKNLVAVIVGVIFVPLALLTIYFSDVDWTTGKDSSREPVAKFNAGASYEIVGYRTNGGATTNWGILIYKERIIVPGFLKWVEPAVMRYPACDVSFELDNQNRLHCKFSGSADDREERVIAL